MRAERFGSSDHRAALLRFAGPRLAAALFGGASVPLLVVSGGIGLVQGLALLLLMIQALPASKALAGGDFERARDLSHLLFPFGCLGALLLWPWSSAAAFGASLLLPFEAALRGDERGLRGAVRAAVAGTAVTAAVEAGGSPAMFSGVLAAGFTALTGAVLAARAFLHRAQEHATDRAESAAAARVAAALAGGPLLLLTADGRVAEADPAVGSQESGDDAVRDWASLVHPADRSAFFTALSLARPGGEAIGLTLRLRDGEDWDRAKETPARLCGVAARTAPEGRLVYLALAPGSTAGAATGTGAGASVPAYDDGTFGDDAGPAAMPVTRAGIRSAA